MAVTNTDASNLALIGERLCLDFANTASWHEKDYPDELLTSYDKLVVWSKHAGILSSEQGEALLEESDRSPRKAEKVLGNCIELRETIFRIFRQVAKGENIDSSDLSIFNQYLEKAYRYAEILPDGKDFKLSFRKGEEELDCMLWPIIQSAVDLLLSEKLDRVKQCEGDPCGWLFYDTSRNKSRRWCTMEDCGNREKARRHYRKKKLSK